MTRFRILATLAVAIVVPWLAGCGGGPIENNALPHEGTWRLVRLNGQPLPSRLDTLEVVSEDVRFIFNGSGFIRLTQRRFASAAAQTGTTALCEAWFGYQLLLGTQINTVPSATQAPSGVCPRQVVSRAYVLDGDTLRSNGGTGFTPGISSLAYVRISQD